MEPVSGPACAMVTVVPPAGAAAVLLALGEVDELSALAGSSFLPHPATPSAMATARPSEYEAFMCVSLGGLGRGRGWPERGALWARH